MDKPMFYKAKFNQNYNNQEDEIIIEKEELTEDKIEEIFLKN